MIRRPPYFVGSGQVKCVQCLDFTGDTRYHGDGFIKGEPEKYRQKGDRVMKRLVLMVVAAAMMCSLAGCSSKCKESGCDDKAEKNGYCQTHWALHELEKLFS